VILEMAVARRQSQGRGARSKARFAQAQRIISASPGYLSHELRRCLENPDRYLLLVHWRALEDHTEGFRKSAALSGVATLAASFLRPVSCRATL